MRRPLRWPYPWALSAAVTALAAAAMLVVYLQSVEAEQHRQQTAAIVQQMCGRTVAEVRARVQEVLDGPFVASIAEVAKPEIRRYRLSNVLGSFKDGLNQYPYVSRFFVWSERMPARFRGQVLFIEHSSEVEGERIVTRRRDGTGDDTAGADSHLGRLFLKRAEELSPLRKSYVVLDEQVAGRAYQVVIHYLWANPLRTGYHAIIGYVVDHEHAPRVIFGDLLADDLVRALQPDPLLPQLRLTVQDEHGRAMYGDRVQADVPAARTSVDMLFFPGVTLNPYLGARPAPRRWTLTVSAAAPVAVWSVTRYWAAGAAVLLILIALFCAVSVARQANRLSWIHADFVANVSHQLKTPLSTLQGASETLRLGRVRSPEKVKEYANIVQAQTQRLSRLVEQMLELSKSPDEVKRRREPVDLGGLVDASVTEFVRDCPECNGDITVEASPDPMVVEGDPDALHEVVVNLLDNAVKYANGRPNLISVRVHRAGESALIAIRDRGMGIPAPEIPHIFEKFYRGRTDAHRLPGFGLGLAIVRSVVHAHGGRVSVTSSLGEGSEFRVLLPVVPKGTWYGSSRAGR